MLLLALLACSENELKALDPSLSVAVDALDFEEVVVGTQRTGTLTISNEGGGTLNIDDVALEGSADFTLEEALPDSIAPRDEVAVPVRYTPDAIGPDSGTLTLLTDDPESPTRALRLTGEGVEPEIDIDPETLWFGTVEPGDSVTRSVDINARGQGALIIDDIGLVDDAAEVFSYVLPDGLSLPMWMEPGTGFTIDVTFAPTDLAAWDAELYITSNDPDDADARVRLLGNSDETGEEAPQVEITRPDWGNQIRYGTTVTLSGVAIDDATAPEDLVVLWYADGSLLGSSTPDETGAVSLETSALPLGEITLRLAALDADGQVGEDDVDVTVYDTAEPTPYLLTGGSSLWDYWSIDDDIVLYLDGAEVFRDSNDTQDSHAPVAIDAKPGQTLRLVATDVNACDQALDALTLHWGTGSNQPLNEAWCRSSCPSHECYDPDFVGPWPDTFLDVSYEIAIP